MADAGCVVLVVREFDEPRPAHAMQMVDMLFAAPEASVPTPGLISANFFISLDGRRVLNYAEWTTVEAHRRLAEQSSPALEASPEWETAHNWPGLMHTEFKRCTWWRSAARGV